MASRKIRSLVLLAEGVRCARPREDNAEKSICRLVAAFQQELATAGRRARC